MERKEENGFLSIYSIECIDKGTPRKKLEMTSSVETENLSCPSVHF